MYCRNCGNLVANNATVCQSCGNSPHEGSNYCPSCGHFCIPGDTECIQCKEPLLTPRTHNTTTAAPPPFQQAQPAAQAEPQRQKTITTNVGPKFLSDNQRYCRNCGLVIPSDAASCPFCDSTTGSNYCQKCGSGTAPTDEACSVCSTPLKRRREANYIPSQPPSTQRRTGTQQPHSIHTGAQETYDWLVALLLGIFLGYLGVHRFYTKNYIAGVLQLVTGGGCGIWWLIDIVLILTDTYTDGNGNKLQRTI